MQIFLVIWFAPLLFIVGGIVAGLVFVNGSPLAKVAAGSFFGAGALMVALGGWWTYLWLFR